MLVDNCTAHDNKESLPELQNVRVEYLSPKNTGKAQPLDVGIIAWVKSKYKRRILFCVFENIEMGRKSIYNVDILTAIRWTAEEWANSPAQVIRNCFDYCFKRQEIYEEGSGLVREEMISSMEQVAEEHHVAYKRDGLESLFQLEGEDDVEEQVDLEDLRNEVAVVENGSQCSNGEDNVEEEENKLSTAEELRCLAMARCIMERHGVLDEDG